jgi:hypothetical protein
MAEVVREGMGYVMQEPEAMTEFTADRLMRTRGDVYAYVQVRCGLPGTRSRTGHLHGARMNLSSTSARGTLSKVLMSRANIPGLDWFGLVEDFCRGVLEAEREGTPIVMVGTRPRVAGGVTWRIDPLVPLGMPAILFGEGGSGKSTLAAAFAVSCETGAVVVPGFVPRRCPTLYLDWEGDQDQINERVAGVAIGSHNRNPVSIRYRQMIGPIADQADDLARYIDREGIGLVIVDSIGPASGTSSDGGDASEGAIRLFAAFRIMGTTVLAIDHVSKASIDLPTQQGKPYGSIYKTNLARSTWELRRASGALAMFHTKSNASRLFDPRGLSITYGDGGEIAYSEAAIQVDDPKLAAGMSNAERMWHALMEHGHKTMSEIEELTGIKHGSVSAELGRRKDLFNRLNSGQYEALPKGRERGVA